MSDKEKPVFTGRIILVNTVPYSVGDLVETADYPGIVWEIEAFKFGVDNERPLAFCLRYWGADPRALSHTEEGEAPWRLRFGRQCYAASPTMIRIPNEMLLLAIAAGGWTRA